MKFISSNNLKKYIDEHLDEADIISRYMDIPITDIYKCINNKNYRVNNTFRNDNNPSYGFQYIRSRGRIKLFGKDFANPFYTGDKYHIVGIALNLNSNNPKDFVNICKHIISTYKNSTSAVIPSKTIYDKEVYKPKIVRIDIVKRQWDVNDYKYWGKIGISFDMLNREKVFPVSTFALDNSPNDYIYYPEDPAYAYYLGFNTHHIWEIYRPFASKYFKFRTNNIADIKQLHKVKRNDNLILTKSNKDKLLLLQMMEELDIIDTDVLYTSESVKLRKTTINKLNNNYRNIYVNFDLDHPGVQAMKFFNNNYGFNIFPFIIEDIMKLESFPKDASDFSERYGYDNAKKLFNILYKKYINND